MVQLFKDLWGKLTDERNKVAGSGGMLSGWIISFHVLLQSPSIALNWWIFVAKTAIGICISVFTAFCVLITKDFYVFEVKPKIFKKKLNEKETDDQRAA